MFQQHQKQQHMSSNSNKQSNEFENHRHHQFDNRASTRQVSPFSRMTQQQNRGTPSNGNNSASPIGAHLLKTAAGGKQHPEFGLHSPPENELHEEEYIDSIGAIKPFDHQAPTGQLSSISGLEHQQRHEFFTPSTSNALRNGWVAANPTLDSPISKSAHLNNGIIPQIGFGASSGMISAQPLTGANFPKSQESSQTSSNGSISPRPGLQQPHVHLKQQMMVPLQTSFGEPAPDRFEVLLRCVTWSRDSHGLFDYESRYIAKKNIRTMEGGRLVRLLNDVEFISKQDKRPLGEISNEAKPLITIAQNQQSGKFGVTNDTVTQSALGGDPINDQSNRMFVVVRNLKSANRNVQDYKLNKGDTIKLGRLKFCVKDFRTDIHPSVVDGRAGMKDLSPVKQAPQWGGRCGDGEDDFAEEEAVEIDCGVVDTDDSGTLCKICWGTEQSIQNPLLTSCKCDGSVRYTHFECLKHWLKQKMAKKEEPNVISYTWKQFECEICKKPYPYVFKSNGRRYRLVDVEVPAAPKKFLWLESLTFEKNSSRMVHLIMPDQDHASFKMGRGHESDLRVSDISVSRCHAVIKFDPEIQQFFLEDNLSKFGTLVLANSSIELEINQTRAIQIGRSVISFTVKKMNPSQGQMDQTGTDQLQQKQQMAQNLGKKMSQPGMQVQMKQPSELLRTPSPLRVDPIQQYQQQTHQKEGRPLQNQQQIEAEEILRQRIEETNQKINDFLQQSGLPNQIVQRPTPEQLLHAEALIPTRLDYYRPATVDTFDRQTIQTIQMQQEEQSPYQKSGLSVGLSSTLMKFQSMIKQVEQRFAARDNQQQQDNSHDSMQRLYGQRPENNMYFDGAHANMGQHRQKSSESASPLCNNSNSFVQRQNSHGIQQIRRSDSSSFYPVRQSYAEQTTAARRKNDNGSPSPTSQNCHQQPHITTDAFYKNLHSLQTKLKMMHEREQTPLLNPDSAHHSDSMPEPDEEAKAADSSQHSRSIYGQTTAILQPATSLTAQSISPVKRKFCRQPNGVKQPEGDSIGLDDRDHLETALGSRKLSKDQRSSGAYASQIQHHRQHAQQFESSTQKYKYPEDLFKVGNQQTTLSTQQRQMQDRQKQKSRTSWQVSTQHQTAAKSPSTRLIASSLSSGEFGSYSAALNGHRPKTSNKIGTSTSVGASNSTHHSLRPTSGQRYGTSSHQQPNGLRKAPLSPTRPSKTIQRQHNGSRIEDHHAKLFNGQSGSSPSRAWRHF